MIELTTQALFTQYLDVVNRAMGEHRDELPFKPILAAGETLLADRKVGVGVYRDEPAHPHDWFTIQLQGGTFDLLAHGKEEPAVTCKVARSHLEEVVAHPRTYIDNPAKLDLDWLRSRLSL